MLARLRKSSGEAPERELMGLFLYRDSAGTTEENRKVTFLEIKQSPRAVVGTYRLFFEPILSCNQCWKVLPWLAGMLGRKGETCVNVSLCVCSLIRIQFYFLCGRIFVWRLCRVVNFLFACAFVLLYPHFTLRDKPQVETTESKQTSRSFDLFSMCWPCIFSPRFQAVLGMG